MHIHGSSAVVDGQLQEKVCIKGSDGVITAITLNCAETPDSSHSGTLIPGFVDIHSHGGAGFYFSDLSPENVAAARNTHLSHGTTTHIASLVTEPIGVLEEQILRLVPMVNAGVFEGIHLEGPYLSHARCGAHEPSLLRSPDIDELSALLDAGQGAITMITLAPELDSGIEAVEYLTSRGITVALGHSQADAATTNAAFAAGAKLITHFSNGMPKPSAGATTIAEASLAEKRIPLEMIIDGVHVSDEILKEVLASGDQRTILITDSMSAAGGADGSYSIGSLDVVVIDGVARLTSNHSLAGSTLTMDQAFINFIKVNNNIVDCVFAASTLPAKTLGLHAVGEIAVGKKTHILEYTGTEIKVVAS
ncbi:N-acetylglucosamine-6-phosphate deacetylase [Candidatus Planktophila dulcis]|uniref:N-acetylglucosamine-6-phosphate deacetylase n=1 Tax=Candidatus Planktophila dulcis TaxID=1884914 RepID=UPI003BEEDFA0